MDSGGSHRQLAAAALGLALAMALALLLGSFTAGGVVTDPYLQVGLGYAVFWVPLLGAVLLGNNSIIRLRFRPIDLLWGIGVGFIARAVASAIDLTVYGTPPVVNVPASAILVVFTLLAAPLVIGPVIEELFFRGLVFSAIRGSSRDLPTTAVAVVASALIFALMHLIGATTPSGALASGLDTFALGLGAGMLAAATNRLGGAIIAHAVFNGAIMVLSLLAARAVPPLG